MSLTVTQRPSITYNSETSRWNAVRNPIVYKMQRKDFAFNQVNNSGGFVQLQFNSVNLVSSFDVGASVYVKSDNGVYDLVGEVTARSFSTNTLVTLDAAYVSAAPGGFVNNYNLRTMYRVEVSVYNSDDELLNESPLFVIPSSTGAVLADISTVLKVALSYDLDADLTGTDQIISDENARVKFYIKYREFWTGSAESQSNDSANQFFASLSARQIPAANGGNMAEYNIPENLFLTKLTQFVMWVGYPSLLSAIINEDVAADIYLASDDDQSAAEDHAGNLVHFDINQIITDQTVNEVDVTIYEDTSAPGEISETKTVKIREACDNPVMLMGRNSLGGIIQWMFDENQEYSHDYGDGIKVKRLVLITDNLTINEWEALQDFITIGEQYRNNIPELTSSVIKTSSRTDNQVYVLYPDGSKVGVIVNLTRNTTETMRVKHNFELEIEFPEQF